MLDGYQGSPPTATSALITFDASAPQHESPINSPLHPTILQPKQKPESFQGDGATNFGFKGVAGTGSDGDALEGVSIFQWGKILKIFIV